MRLKLIWACRRPAPLNSVSESSSVRKPSRSPHPRQPHPGYRDIPDGSARPGDGLPVNILRPDSRALLVGIGGNQAGIDRKGSPVDQPFGHAAPDHGLEQLSQQIAVTEAAMPILGEGRVVRHLAVKAEPTEPTVSEVQVNLFAPDVPSECRSSSQPATSGRGARDQSKAGQ